ncbi:GNAT family N-acetyltransferase [Paenibacillus sp. NEAU-GSW1]|uniref:GNAT family N-acetyltransferase n=1 Tax=Paenibacillus sp. NEAU-GSW1 TaxID=2682486 RepID=UPI0012E2C79F|nr:GNAT family N-acetyltransferase [Paenibacillus sp. NEAU-GSW1]MUT66623.1 GNAT family N-acetyltransferase [Paenibacillus sp. NEAU-GSW1]
MVNSIWNRLEELSLNSWPALETRLYGGWLLRFADGYTKRSNCVVPLYSEEQSTETGELERRIAYCEQIYEGKGQDSIYKVFSFTPQIDLALEQNGYEKVDPVWLKTMELSRLPQFADEELRFELFEAYDERWLEQYSAMSALGETSKLPAAKLLHAMPDRKCFLTLYEEGEPAACGVAVLEDGWVALYDIITDTRFRQRGLAERLVRKLLQWGREQGAEFGYLMVLQHNVPANRLYDKIGFEQQYDYWYRVKKRTFSL